MKIWEYRIVKFNGDEGDGLYICEVYTIDGTLPYYTVTATPFGETQEELLRDFEYMKEAFKKPVLEWSDDEKLVEVPE